MKILKKYNISNTDAIVMLVAVLLQAITAIWAKDNMLSFVSGMAGIISVVLCSQKKLTFYLFAFIQMITYMILTYREALWGEVIENWFYMITSIVGIVIWIIHYNKEKYEVKTRVLNEDFRIMWFILFVFGTLFVTFVLHMTNDPYPFLDAVSTVPDFIAQILMITGYKDQWKYWLIVDVSSIVMWAIIGNWCLVMQFILWTANCIYGMYKWSKT